MLVPKLFVTASHKEDAQNQKQDEDSPDPQLGAEIAQFYASCFEETEMQPVSHSQDITSQKSFHCDVCDIQVFTSRRIHECNITHQINQRSNIKEKIHFPVARGNPGYQILLKNGWKETGLGKDEQGITFPIKTRIKNDRLGIGIPPRCAERVTHTEPPPKRPKLEHRTLPNVENMQFFDAMNALQTTKEQTYAITKKHRSLLIKRDKIKHDLIRKEIFTDSPYE
jgi:hypothetical protein